MGSYSISAQRSWDEYSQTENSIYLSFSIPIEKLMGTEHRDSGFQSIDTQLSTNMDGNNQFNMSSSGYSNDNRVSYSVNAGYGMNKTGKDLSNIGVMPAMNRHGNASWVSLCYQR